MACYRGRILYENYGDRASATHSVHTYRPVGCGRSEILAQTVVDKVNLNSNRDFAVLFVHGLLNLC